MFNFRNNQKQQPQQQNQQQQQTHPEMHTQMTNHPIELTDAHQQQQQLPNQSQQTMMQPQTSPPPPLQIQPQAYGYPMAYNQQVPFVPIGHYPADADAAYPGRKFLWLKM